MYRLLLVLLFSSLSCFVNVDLSYAQSLPQKFTIFKNNASKPLDIEADLIEVDQDTGKALIQGEVIIRQENSKLEADEVEIIYSGNVLNESEERAVKEMLIKGNVILSLDQDKIQADRMTYNFNTGIAVLSGHVRVLSKGTRSEAEKVTIDTNKGTLVAGKTGTRVRTTIKLK